MDRNEDKTHSKNVLKNLCQSLFLKTARAGKPVCKPKNMEPQKKKKKITTHHHGSRPFPARSSEFVSDYLSLILSRMFNQSVLRMFRED